MFLEFKI